MRTRIALVVSLLLLAGVAGAQSGTPNPRLVSFSSTMNFSAVRMAPPVVTGMPYSAEQYSGNQQTLADGTHITRTEHLTQKIYRDSAGRTRTERPVNGPPDLIERIAELPMVVEIGDPAAGFHYVLDPAAKVAHRQAYQARPERGRGGIPGAAEPASAGTVVSRAVYAGTQPPRTIGPQISVEKLGTENIEGVLAEGTRSTNTYPVDSIGNDRAFSVIGETWRSVDLQVDVLTKHNDPRSLEVTTRLKNIQRGEPDASLFQPPADYKIVDEAGSFTVKFTAQQ